jgi:hypothetical protein
MELHKYKKYWIKEVLSLMDALPSFSIEFVKADGELMFLALAQKGRVAGNWKKNRMVGVQPIDVNLNRTGHPYPVKIDRIISFNGKPVIL